MLLKERECFLTVGSTVENKCGQMPFLWQSTDGTRCELGKAHEKGWAHTACEAPAGGLWKTRTHCITGTIQLTRPEKQKIDSYVCFARGIMYAYVLGWRFHMRFSAFFKIYTMCTLLWYIEMYGHAYEIGIMAHGSGTKLAPHEVRRPPQKSKPVAKKMKTSACAVGTNMLRRLLRRSIKILEGIPIQNMKFSCFDTNSALSRDPASSFNKRKDPN